MSRRVGGYDPIEARIARMMESFNTTEVTRQSGDERQTFDVDPQTGALQLTKTEELPGAHPSSNPIAALLRAFGKEDGFDEPKKQLVALS